MWIKTSIRTKKRPLSYTFGECPDCKEAVEGQMAVHQSLRLCGKDSRPLMGLPPGSWPESKKMKKGLLSGVSLPFSRSFCGRLRWPSPWSSSLSVWFPVICSSPAEHRNRPMTVRESFSLDLFQATPPDSIGGVYVTLAGATDER